MKNETSRAIIDRVASLREHALKTCELPYVNDPKEESAKSADVLTKNHELFISHFRNIYREIASIRQLIENCSQSENITMELRDLDTLCEAATLLSLLSSERAITECALFFSSKANQIDAEDSSALGL